MFAKRMAAALITTAIIATLIMPIRAQEQEIESSVTPKASKANALVGAWTANFLSVDNPPSFPPIPVLITFTSDGTLIEGDGSQVVPIPPPPDTAQIFGTTGHGVWHFVSGNRFTIKFIQFGVNSDSSLAAQGTLEFSLELDGARNTFHGVGTFKFVDGSGNVLAEGSEDLDGKRIE
jgi:hypothetical protein